MGLDTVEFAMGVEQAIGIPIPDDVAATIRTPRHLIEYLHSQLPHSRESRCLSQRAFYRLRQAVAKRLGPRAAKLRPGTEILRLFPTSTAQADWAAIGDLLGYSGWARARGNGWFARTFFRDQPRTLGEAARHLAGFSPAVLKQVDEGWSWSEVVAVVAWQMQYRFGIHGYSLDDRFAEDLGLD
jgi:hypothetical protein